MTPSKSLRNRQVVSVLFVWLLTVLGCAEALAQASHETGEPPLTDGPPATAPSSSLYQAFPALSLSELALIEDNVASEATLAHFQVSVDLARRFARGYVLERGYLTEPLVECLYLPKLDIEGHVLGHFFLLSTEPDCADFATLVERAAAISEQARSEAPAESAASAWMLRAHQLSADHFFTITVSGYAFRPPLDLGHQGLPLFLIHPAELPARCAASPEPDAIILAHDDSLHEAVSYPCRQGAFWYSHYARREMGADEALQPALGRTLSDWKRNVVHSGDFAATGLLRLNRRWMSRISAGSQNADVNPGGVR